MKNSVVIACSFVSWDGFPIRSTFHHFTKRSVLGHSSNLPWACLSTGLYRCLRRECLFHFRKQRNTKGRLDSRFWQWYTHVLQEHRTEMGTHKIPQPLGWMMQFVWYGALAKWLLFTRCFKGHRKISLGKDPSRQQQFNQSYRKSSQVKSKKKVLWITYQPGMSALNEHKNLVNSLPGNCYSY